MACDGALVHRLAGWTLPLLGGRRYTAFSNLSMVAAWVLLGRARSLAAVAIALVVSLWTVCGARG